MLSVSIQNNVQILDVEVLQLDAVLPVESLLKQRVVSVDVVKNLVSVLLLTCRENYDFVPLDKFFEDILHIWAQSHLNFRPLEGELKRRFEAIGDVAFKFRGNQCLIHIKDKQSVLSFGAELERFEHDFILVVLGFLV